MTHRVAALFVQPRGTYSTMEDVDCWPESRDARLYAGPLPVVAHPPCSRWCQLAHVVEARYGHKVGDDDGCFRWLRTREGGWVCHVEQGKYGHRARKATWLYFVGRRPYVVEQPPELLWGRATPTATVSFMTNHGGGSLPRLSKREASKSPPTFARMLVELAASAARTEAA